MASYPIHDRTQRTPLPRRLGETRVQGDLPSAYKQIAALFDRAGITIPKGSRLFELGCIASQFTESRREPTVSATDQVFWRALYDLWAWNFIADALSTCPKTPILRKRLKCAIADTFLPKPSCNNPGRDAEYELFVFSALHKAGARPTLEEPDIVIHTTPTLCVAVKRFTSQSIGQLERQIRAATDQIRRQGIPGVITLDITSYATSGTWMSEGITATELLTRAEAIGKSFRLEFCDRFRKWSDPQHVLAIFADYRFPNIGKQPDDPVVIDVMDAIELIATDDPRYRLLRTIDEYLSKGYGCIRL